LISRITLNKTVFSVPSTASQNAWSDFNPRGCSALVQFK
jgi:hypothetical protein